MKKRMSKAEKLIEEAVAKCVQTNIQNVQIDIMDLEKISTAGRDAARNNLPIDDAVKAAVQQYRQN